jgi:hypothetical protein
MVFILINSIRCSTDDIESITSQLRAQQVTIKIGKIVKELEKEENQLKIDYKKKS